MQDIYIVSGVRTAVGDFGGSLKSFMPADMGQLVAAEAIRRAGLAPADIGHVVIGQVMQTSARDNMLSRVIALRGILQIQRQPRKAPTERQQGAITAPLGDIDGRLTSSVQSQLVSN